MPEEKKPKYTAENLAAVTDPAAREFLDATPDALAMLNNDDSGLRGQELVDHWANIGRGDGGFYDSIRVDGCSSCGSHTPGCCDGCA